MESGADIHGYLPTRRRWDSRLDDRNRKAVQPRSTVDPRVLDSPDGPHDSTYATHRAPKKEHCLPRKRHSTHVNGSRTRQHRDVHDSRQCTRKPLAADVSHSRTETQARGGRVGGISTHREHVPSLSPRNRTPPVATPHAHPPAAGPTPLPTNGEPCLFQSAMLITPRHGCRPRRESTSFTSEGTDGSISVRNAHCPRGSVPEMLTVLVVISAFSYSEPHLSRLSPRFILHTTLLPRESLTRQPIDPCSACHDSTRAFRFSIGPHSRSLTLVLADHAPREITLVLSRLLRPYTLSLSLLASFAASPSRCARLRLTRARSRPTAIYMAVFGVGFAGSMYQLVNYGLVSPSPRARAPVFFLWVVDRRRLSFGLPFGIACTAFPTVTIVPHRRHLRIEFSISLTTR